VEHAKQVRSIYWHIPLKNGTTQPRSPNIRHVNTVREDPIPDAIASAQTTTQRPEYVTGRMTLGDSNAVHRVPLFTSQAIEQPTVLAPQQVQTFIEAQAPVETMSTSQAPPAPSVEEWDTPQQEVHLQPDQLIDPQTRIMEESLSPIRVMDNQPQPSWPTDGIEGAPTMQDADAWLEDMAN
jgi:hypothetical protein